ncbi:hypothetical protein [Maritimibacter sp. DP1N21-5]|uniref:hypothetical protein n=1 Tax=Maritimibacter sp. DP1N21-5 TaxID=2836867 RepID=UPI001C451323|nr:hypothetical protein [Maritimibacter sp. DP1N21-5]MBV7408346.1 hypothetical protein [Maritimibacter sp. DP1N21-5]
MRQLLPLAIAVMTLLSACSGAGFGTGMTGAPVRVLDGRVTLAPPLGYCADRSTLRDDATGAFVLYGACGGKGNSASPASAPAVLTAAAAPAFGAETASAEGIATLATFLETDAGRGALSRTDSGAAVEVLSLERTSDLILVRARDGATGDLAPDYWRGIFLVQDALVTVTVSGTRPSTLTSQAGRDLMIDFIATIRAANPVSDTAPAPATPARSSEKGLGAFFKRLL